MAKSTFKPAAEYVRAPNGRVYAATGAMAHRKNVFRLTPEQAAEAQAAQGIDSDLTRHFKSKAKPAEPAVVDEKKRHSADELAARAKKLKGEELRNEAERLGVKFDRRSNDSTLRDKVLAAWRANEGPGGGDSRSGGDDGDQRRDEVGAAVAADQLASQPNAGMIITEDEKTADELDRLLNNEGK